MTTFAQLGIQVDSSPAAKAADDLDRLVDSAEGAEQAIDNLSDCLLYTSPSPRDS